MSTCDVRAGRLVAAMAAAVLLHAGDARAQASAQDQATARALFNEARDLMKVGRYPDACAKLESASELYEGSGLLLNLGDCYEHLGRTASAWTEFSAAVAAAERTGRADDFAEARRRQAAVEPRLSRLVIRVKADVPGLVVRRDGSELARGAWSAAVPVDPGEHRVTAEAPGRRGWTGTAAVSEPGTVSIDVPELAPTPAPAPPPPASPAAQVGAVSGESELPAAPGYWTGRRIASASLAAVGVLGVAAGGVIALVAKGNDDTARGEAANNFADSTSAVNLGNVATVIVGAGAAVAATGLVLWLTAPDASVHVGTTARALFVAGSF
jgi:hypothetical protein